MIDNPVMFIFPTNIVGLNIPYLKPKANPLPTRGIPPPISAPSCPYFNLLVNLAIAKSLPSNPFSLTFFVNSVGISASDNAISVKPKDNAPLPERKATSAVALKYH